MKKSILLLIILMLVNSLFSCDSQIDGSLETTETEPKSINDVQTVAQAEIMQNVPQLEPDPDEWVVKYLELPEGYEFAYTGYDHYNKYFYDKEKQTISILYKLKLDEDTPPDNTIYVAEYDTRGNFLNSRELPYGSEFYYSSSYIKITDYGYIVLKVNKYISALYKYYDKTNKLECVFDKLPIDALPSWNADIFEGSDGNTYLFSYNANYEQFFVLSPEGKVLFDYETQKGERAFLYITERDNQVYVCDVKGYYWTVNFDTNDFEVPDYPKTPKQYDNDAYNSRFKVLESRSKSIGLSFTRGRRLISGGDYAMYYIANDGLYAHNDSNVDNPDIIVNFEALGLTLNTASIIDIYTPTCIMMRASSDLQPSTFNSKVPAVLYFDDTRPSASRQVLTIAHLAPIDQDFRTAISYFNKTNSSYRIKTVDYSGYDDPVSQIEKEFGAGKYPDMLILPSQNTSRLTLDMNNLTSKGFFANLIELGFDADTMVPSVRTTVEYGGGLYRLPMNFRYDALVNDDDIESMTLDDLIALYETHGNALLRQFDRDDLWDYLVRAGILADFIDYGNATCSFDSENFIKLIEFLKKYNNAKIYDVDNAFIEDSKKITILDELWSEIIEGDGVFLQSIGLVSGGQLAEYELLYSGDYSLSGFPTGYGSGIIITPINEICVMKAASSYEGAMEFIDLIYSSDQSRESFWASRLRTNREFEEESLNAKFALGNLMYYDPMTNRITASTKSDYEEMISRMKEPPNHYTFEITEEAVADFISRILEAEVRPADDVGLLGILDDELVTYLGGQGDARSTAARIQSRAKIYLSERYG